MGVWISPCGVDNTPQRASPHCAPSSNILLGLQDVLRKVDHGILEKLALAIGNACDLYGDIMSQDIPSDLKMDGANLRIGIAAARFNESYVDTLLENTVQTLAECNASEPEILRVPGSNELPYAANLLAGFPQVDAVIVLGLVLAGETEHHNHIAQSTGIALQQISIASKVPVINGIIVVENADQAAARCGGNLNRGREFAKAALEMAQLKF